MLGSAARVVGLVDFGGRLGLVGVVLQMHVWRYVRGKLADRRKIAVLAV